MDGKRQDLDLIRPAVISDKPELTILINHCLAAHQESILKETRPNYYLMSSLIVEVRVWQPDQAPVLPLLPVADQCSHHSAGWGPHRGTGGGSLSGCLHDNVLHQQTQIPEVLEVCSSSF